MLANIALVTLALSSVVNLLLGYSVLSKNFGGAVNRLFALLSVALVGWSTSEYLGIAGSRFSLALGSDFVFLSLHLIFSFLALQNVSFFLLASYFPEQRLLKRRVFTLLATVFGLLVVVLPFSGDFFAQNMIMDGEHTLMPGPGMMITMISILFFAIAGFVVLKRKLAYLTDQAKNQARYLIVAGAILWVLVPIVDFVLPTIFGWSFAYVLSPVLTLLFALTIAYAIVKQRLFDIRPIAARSVSYGLFLITLVIVYVVVAFGLSSLFTSG